MPAYKDKERGTWMANFYYTNWQGERKRKNKRGFPTKKEALAYERQFLQQTGGDMEMEFASYAELYLDDVKLTVKESTWEGKVHYINSKMIPYFGKMKMCDITAKTVMDWHKEKESIDAKNDISMYGHIVSRAVKTLNRMLREWIRIPKAERPEAKSDLFHQLIDYCRAKLKPTRDRGWER